MFIQTLEKTEDISVFKLRFYFIYVLNLKIEKIFSGNNNLEIHKGLSGLFL